jgi:N,N'-diacetyllegionaminate synthase
MSGIPLFETEKVFIIAEAGVNHNGSIELAKKLVDVAKNADADAVKFQTFKSSKVISKKATMAEYQKQNIGKETSQLDMILPLELTYSQFTEIKKYCDQIGILFLSTPFDEDSVDFLDTLVPLFKIGSGEITNFPLLRKIAQKSKPIILSTGMSYLGEVERAIAVIVQEGNSNLSLLHCTTNYPCHFDEVNLNAMITLKEAFKLPIGYSDHTIGIVVPIAAVAMGAKIIEKHFTLDKNLPGPDHKASLDPCELKKMVEAIRNIEQALGDGIKKPNQSEFKVMTVARKSLVAARNLKAGEIVLENDIAVKRPGDGIKPEFIDILVGKKLVKDIEEDEVLSWEYFFHF